MAGPYSAIAANCAGAPDSDPLSRMRTERERLTQLLRAMAADLDEIDRRLSDMEWRRDHPTGRSADDPAAQRVRLERQRDLLNTRLHVLAGQLTDLDCALSVYRRYEQWPQARVGTCPDCGYPSLESRLCATCRWYLTGPNPLLLIAR